jgi:hypothetical protein
MSSKDFLYSISNLSKYLPQASEKNKNKREQEQVQQQIRLWGGNLGKKQVSSFNFSLYLTFSSRGRNFLREMVGMKWWLDEGGV